MAPLQGFTPATPAADVLWVGHSPVLERRPPLSSRVPASGVVRVSQPALFDSTGACLGGALSADLVPGGPAPAASSHLFDFQKWDGRWTGFILDQPAPLILHHLGLQRVPVAGDGHCFFSALLVCLGVAPTLIALQQFREVLSCHVDLCFESLLLPQLPELATKAQFLRQLRCFSQQAPYEHWGDAKCCLAFTSCYGQSVVILSAGPEQKHWAFTQDACKTLFLLFDPEAAHYEAVIPQRPSGQLLPVPPRQPLDLVPSSNAIKPSGVAQATRAIQCTQAPPLHNCRPIVLIEAFAGLGILSLMASQFGVEPSAFLERNELLRRLLHERHPKAQQAADYSGGEWKLWSFPPDALIVVVGGPPCTTVSSAGKQLGAKDARSACLTGFIEIAAFFQASMALMENVDQLVSNDHIHGLYSAIIGRAEESGLHHLGTFTLVDAGCGGFSQRSRSWLQFEIASLTMMLPLWSPPQASGPPALLNNVLLSPELVPERYWLTGNISLQHHSSSPSHAVVAAELVVHEKGAAESWPPEVGCLVRLRKCKSSTGFGTQFGSFNVWRVLLASDGFFTLVRAQRKQPDRLIVRLSSITCVLEEKVNLYDPFSAAVTIRRWGEPPLKGGFAVLQILDGVPRGRVLMPQELWAVQSLPLSLKQSFRDVGAQQKDEDEAAGNCITPPMAAAALFPFLKRACLAVELVSVFDFPNWLSVAEAAVRGLLCVW